MMAPNPERRIADYGELARRIDELVQPVAPAALDWATAGVEQCFERSDDAELQLLLRLRYRIRVDLGLDEDDYDRMLDGTRS